MSEIKVDTDKVYSAAIKIDNYNYKIKNKFNDIDKKIKILNSSWNSTSSSEVIGEYYSIKNNYQVQLNSVIKGYTNFLKQQVDTGYEQTEKVNKSLADAFK